MRTVTPAAKDRLPTAPECMRACGVGSSFVSCPVPLTFTPMVRNSLGSDTMVDVDCITASETGHSHHTKILDSAPAGHLHLLAVQVLTNPAAQGLDVPTQAEQKGQKLVYCVHAIACHGDHPCGIATYLSGAGRVRGSPAHLREDERVKAAYLGG